MPNIALYLGISNELCNESASINLELLRKNMMHNLDMEKKKILTKASHLPAISVLQVEGH